jgi:hypothetical protein
MPIDRKWMINLRGDTANRKSNAVREGERNIVDDHNLVAFTVTGEGRNRYLGRLGKDGLYPQQIARGKQRSVI